MKRLENQEQTQANWNPAEIWTGPIQNSNVSDLKLLQYWRFVLWAPGLWHFAAMNVIASILEENTTFVFHPEDGSMYETVTVYVITWCHNTEDHGVCL